MDDRGQTRPETVFTLLEPEVRKLAEGRFGTPTKVQEQVIPAVLASKGLLVISETGSGKTESVMLPLFSLWLKEAKADRQRKPISILYITPLRSLNRDLLARLKWWADQLGMGISVRHGDTSGYERQMQAQNPDDLMISTPETLQAILVGKLMKEHLKNVRHIIVDEVHELVDSKRGVQLAAGLERLKQLTRTAGIEPQVVGISATIGDPEEIKKFLGVGQAIDTERSRTMDVTVDYPGNAGLDGSVARLEFLTEAVKGSKQTLVFTNTRETAETLSSRLKEQRHVATETHHSSLSREVRIKVEENFKQGQVKALVCTSSLELGIDIGNIDLVVQYGSPRQVAKLVQRVGRSGHSMGKVSKGIVIAVDPDDLFEAAAIAKLALAGRLENNVMRKLPWDILAHQIAGLALDQYEVAGNAAYELLRKAYPFQGMSADDFLQACLFLQELGHLWVNRQAGNDALAAMALKRKGKTFVFYNENLSTIPDSKTYRVIDTYTGQAVASLDAEFIALNGYPGMAFIVKGQAWRILEVTDNRIMAEPLEGLEGAIPAWEGEMIPVPMAVAMEVGRMRREIKARLDAGLDAMGFIRSYPVTKRSAAAMLEAMRKQDGMMGTDQQLVIEQGMEDAPYVVIHSCWGSTVNETIGRAVAALVSARLDSVGFKADPYRMLFRLKSRADAEEVIKVFEGIKPGAVRKVLEVALPNEELFAWHFTHVAKRFGIISKDADMPTARLRKAIRA
ncbi:MAG: DEAD/DEAH box helicase [Candidatus Aenigmarchaeota archaeon]|nr:DEAD/DEAH box helicase [Candidatus Aenigmarchaeota archaeon]